MNCKILGTDADDKETADSQGVSLYYIQSGTLSKCSWDADK